MQNRLRWRRGLLLPAANGKVYAPKVAAGAQGENGRRGGSPHVRCCRPATRAHRSTARILPSRPSAGHQKQFRIPLLICRRNLSLESTLVHAASSKAYSANGTASQESNTSAQRQLPRYLLYRCSRESNVRRRTNDASITFARLPARRCSKRCLWVANFTSPSRNNEG